MRSIDINRHYTGEAMVHEAVSSIVKDSHHVNAARISESILNDLVRLRCLPRSTPVSAPELLHKHHHIPQRQNLDSAEKSLSF